MDDIIVWGIMKNPIQLIQGIRKDLRRLLVMERLHLLKGGEMGLGEDPGLKGKTGGIGSNREKCLVFTDDTRLLMKLLANDVTIGAPVFIIEIGLGPFNLLNHSSWNNRKGNDL